MSRLSASDFAFLLTGKVSQLVSFALLGATAGCGLTPSQSAVIAPKSTVIAHVVGASATSTTWLESATLSYARSQPIAPQTPDLRSQSSSALRVLGVRYPHPDGHKDRGRVELVVADLADDTRATSWHGRFGQALSEALPGMAWGEGIRQAKAIDLPLAELQKLLVKSHGAVALAGSVAPSNLRVQFASEINGHHKFVQTAPIAELEALAARVAREGRLIAYHGSASQLQQGLQQAAQTQLAGATDRSGTTGPAARLALIPLPPVITR